MSVRTSVFASTDGLTAADLNALADQWSSYTPTVSSWTLGNGTLDARYLQFGYLIGGTADLTLGTTTSIAGNYLGLTLPFSVRTGGGSQARAVAEIGSGVFQLGCLIVGNVVRVYALGTNGLFTAPTSSNPTFWNDTDEVHVDFWFEASSI